MSERPASPAPTGSPAAPSIYDDARFAAALDELESQTALNGALERDDSPETVSARRGLIAAIESFADRRVAEALQQKQEEHEGEMRAAADEGVAAGAAVMGASFGRALSLAGLHEVVAKAIMAMTDDAMAAFFAGKGDKMTKEVFQQAKDTIKAAINEHREPEGSPNG